MPAGSTYSTIATYTVPSAQASYTFTSIPGTYTDLVLIIGSAGITASDFIVRMQLNGDTGNNYSFTELYGNGASAASTRDSNRNTIPIAYNVGMANDNNGNIIVNFMNYSNATTNKTVLVRENRAASGTGEIVGLWRSTAAITSIKVECGGAANWTTNSTFTLYGISAA
jgi:hypothetical protein